MSLDNSAQIIRRLRSAEGHLQGVTAMVESGRACEDVLHQLTAVQGALKAVAQMLLVEHIKESETVIKFSDCPEEREQALNYLVSLYHWTLNR